MGCPPPAAGRPPPKDLLPAPKRLDQIARELPARAWRKLSWREGTRGPDAGPLCAGGRSGRATATRSASTRGERAREWLFIEWPPDKEAPTDYWLAHLGSATKTPTLKALVELARERWRVEQDYRELKDELGLDHFEGRSWPGWHHHVALTCLAHLFLQSERAPAHRRRGRAKKTGTKSVAAKACRKPAAACTPLSCGDRALVVLGATPASTPRRKVTK